MLKLKVKLSKFIDGFYLIYLNYKSWKSHLITPYYDGWNCWNLVDNLDYGLSRHEMFRKCINMYDCYSDSYISVYKTDKFITKYCYSVLGSRYY